MKSALSAKHPRPHWGALAFAAGLACSAGGSFAAAATASVTYIQVCANGVDSASGGCLFNPNSTAFVYSPDPGSQSWNLVANGLSGFSSNVNSISPPSSSVNETAQVPGIKATAKSFDAGVDPLTQQPLQPTFSASATVSPTQGGTAFSNFIQSASFCLADGDFACNASGDLTFTIFYDLLADSSAGGAAEASVNVFATGAGRDADFGDATAGSGGSKSGSFTFTYSLLAGERANLDITARALAVPEPAGLALAAMGLFAVGVSRRRRAVAAQAR